MKRTLTLTTLLPLALVSPLALGLGLGDARVGSTLNAPLRANVPLTDTGGLEAGLLNVSLADADAYRAAGLTRTPLAASVDLALRRRQGRMVLELSTERAVREPWVDLLLRFDWPGGRQIREVTLLLDPPDYAAMPALVEGRAPARLADAAGATETPAPSRSVRPAASAPGDPARVRSGDTLWAVASRLRPDSGIGMNQMMLALVQANPEVFPSGNINEMRAGFTLSVPSREAIASRSSREAAELVQAMNRAWANRGGGAPAPVPLGGEAAVAEAASDASADGPAGDAGERDAEPGSFASGDATPRLTLLTDEQAAAGLGGDGAEEGGDGASDAAAGGGEGGATSAASAERIDPEVLASITGAGSLTEDDRLLRLERRIQESRETLDQVRSERDALESEVGGLRDELDALREQVARLAAGGSGADDAGAGGVVPPEAQGGRQATSWWGALYQGAVDRPLMLGGAALALLLGLWALVRRRRGEEEAPSVAMPSAFGEARIARPPGASEAAPSPAPAASRSAMPEAEAISEADIFIAYGRYDQARELLEAGVAREPEHEELRLKLMRVLLEQGDRDAAREQAERLRGSADAAIRAEVDRLMGPSAAPGAGDPAAAVFTAADAHPPRRPGDPVEAAGDAAPSPDAAPPETPEDLTRYRPPTLDVPESPEPDEAPAPAPAPPAAETRVKDDGSRIIDYRPPSLEPAAPREETPSQPEIAFTPGEGPSAEASREPPRAGAWEVEEVAFPTPGKDNVGSDDAVPAAATLDEARALIEVGEVREARDMLERFLEASDDAAAREEARDLLDRHQP